MISIRFQLVNKIGEIQNEISERYHQVILSYLSLNSIMAFTIGKRPPDYSERGRLNVKYLFLLNQYGISFKPTNNL